MLRKLADIFRRTHSQPVQRVVERINPILRGWVNYFAIGHASRCFSYVRDWVEMKIRRHLLRNQQRRGFGWRRRRRDWMYGTLGLFADCLALVHAPSWRWTRHRAWMIRSFALTFGAVTLRLQLPALEVAGFGFETAYPIVAWAACVPNLIVAEWLIRRSLSRVEGIRANATA